MADKKTQQSALDYDPLAWLDEAGSESGSSDDTPTKDSSSSRVTQRETETAVADENEHSEAYGFFEQADAAVPEEKVNELKQQPDEAEQGYGLFDESPGMVASQPARLDDDGQIIETGAELTIRSVAAFKQIVDERLQSGLDIRISAEGLQKIDTAGVQLFYSLSETLAKTRQTIYWDKPSALINEVAAILGMPNLTSEVEEDSQGFGFFDDGNEPATNAKPPEQQESGFGFF